MIEIKNLSKRFGKNVVLDNVSLEIHPGDVLGIIGSSGTGKSTLLRCINFLEKPESGIITIDDVAVDAKHHSSKECLRLRQKTAMVFQNFGLFYRKTALQNVMEGLVVVKRMPKEEAAAIAREELAKYDNQVDCIVTHECSSTVRHFIDMDGEHTNIMTHFFDEITEKVSFKKWFFGCYHMDKVIPPRYYALFEKVLPFE